MASYLVDWNLHNKNARIMRIIYSYGACKICAPLGCIKNPVFITIINYNDNYNVIGLGKFR